jgi:hypothetical protein
VYIQGDCKSVVVFGVDFQRVGVDRFMGVRCREISFIKMFLREMCVFYFNISRKNITLHHRWPLSARLPSSSLHGINSRGDMVDAHMQTTFVSI